MPITQIMRERRAANQKATFKVGDRVLTTHSSKIRPITGVVKDTCEIYGLLVVDETRNVGGWLKVDEVRHV